MPAYGNLVFTLIWKPESGALTTENLQGRLVPPKGTSFTGCTLMTTPLFLVIVNLVGRTGE